MMMQGKIERGRSIDAPHFKNSGWKLIPHKAFKGASPETLASLDPLPTINRPDYKQYLKNNNIPYDF